MNAVKRILCILLCFAMVLPIVGCAQPDTPPVSTEAAVQSEPPVENALAAARELIDNGEYDNAAGMLNQLLETSDDVRIAAMLEEIETLRGIPLEVEYSVDTSWLANGSFQIFGISAVEQASGMILYSVDYLCPVGMKVTLEGCNLDDTCVLMTTGRRDTLDFELDRESLTFMRGQFRLRFANAESDFALVDLTTRMEDGIVTAAEPMEVPFTVSGQMAQRESVEVESVKVFALTETLLAYSVTVKSNSKLNWVTINGQYGDGEVFTCVNDQPRDYFLLGGQWHEFVYYLDRNKVMDSESITFWFSVNKHLMNDRDSQKKTYVQVNLADYELPEYIPVAEGPVVEPEYSLEEIWFGKCEDTFDIHGFTLQLLNNGFIRCTMAYSKTSPEYATELGRIEGFFFNKPGRECYYQGGMCSIKQPEGQVSWYIPVDVVRRGEWFEVHIICDGGDNFLRVTADKEDFFTAKVNVVRKDVSTDVNAENEIDYVAELMEERAKQQIAMPTIDREAAMAVDTSAITPLNCVRSLINAKPQGGINPYDEYWWQPMDPEADLSGNLPLACTLTFSDNTKFPEKIPSAFNPQALLNWGKDPGLFVDVLHELGYTGKGAVIAYVDQPAGEHEEYSGDNFHFINNTDSDSSMHGPAVLSLLAGKEIGTAPEAEVWFYSHAAWKADQITHAECLYQIIEQNKSLPEDRRITMVGFSDNIDPREGNVQAFRDAVKACEEAGIMVWFCSEYGAATFLPMTDKNDYRNLVPERWWGNQRPDLVMVPAAGRTSAATENGAEYIYWSEGGLSWTMPYVLGIYAIVTEIDPSLTQTELRKMIVETAYEHRGTRYINPVGFVAAALEGVGRTEDARILREAAKPRYTYAVMNKSKMTREDILAAESYLMKISGSSVLVVDSTGISTARELYTLLQADCIQRGGRVDGIQIFGDSTLVPAFEVGYKTEYISMNGNAVDNAGTLLTDLFYGNFDNRAEDLSKAYNVMDHFAEGWQVQLIPRWPVARLPLAKGEFTAFFEKYTGFVEQTGLNRQDLVNFSNPIFASSMHTDDMGHFLNRIIQEHGIDLGNYRLYGNLEGKYPVTTEVLGGFTAENLTAENEQGICEFLINSHGQWNNVDKCFFVDGKEKRESLMNMKTINTVLGANPYYLDMWTCNNGWDMKNNLTTTALKGNCVGMFSTTHIISNNGVNNNANVQEMAKSNFYYFYLHYLNALSKGMSRSDAFFEAQKAYGNALIADSQNGIRGEGNYQFNLYNLIGYHNFGVLEPNPMADIYETKAK